MSQQSSSQDYLLGVNQAELDRLRFQQSVWGHVTGAMFDRIKVQNGWKCLDVGAGPGFVSMDLRDRVGETGEVSALEPSQFYLDWFQKEVALKGWNNIKVLQGTAETAPLPSQYYDLIFVRWVIAFVNDPEKFLDRLVRSLKPGGIIAVQDYWYEGLSLYPRGGAFERMPDIVRAYYRSGGGDPYVTGRIPSILKKHGLKTIDLSPHQLAGGPDSPVYEWVHKFLTLHLPMMLEKGVITREECNIQLLEWNKRRANPETICFSPIVLDVAAILPE